MSISKFIYKNTRTINRPIIKLYNLANQTKLIKQVKLSIIKPFLYFKGLSNQKRIKKYFKKNDHEYYKIRSKEDYKQFITNHIQEIDCAKALCKTISLNGNIKIQGFCAGCGKHVDFDCWKSKDVPEEEYFILFGSMVCPKCKSFGRLRAMFYILNKELTNAPNQKIVLHEQVTEFYKTFYANYCHNGNKIIGNEYLGDNIKSGTIINGIRHENAMELSFKNNSIDVIVSNHVYEHVSDINKTISEAYRVLKYGGKVIAGIPFFVDKDKTQILAKEKNGHITYFTKKEIHGNPVSSKGALCFYHYGWDLLDKFKAAGFKDVYLINIIDKKLGNIDTHPCINLIAIK